MFDTVKDAAIEKVWCVPDQDNQLFLKPAKISQKYGEFSNFTLMKRRLSLPHRQNRFHVYQVGQLSPQYVGFLPKKPEWAVSGWIPFSHAVERLPLFAQVYNEEGRQLRLDRVYYRHTEDRALLFAVEVNLFNSRWIHDTAVFFRLYTNAHYGTSEGDALTDTTRTESRTIFTRSDIVTLQGRVRDYREKPGAVFCTVNTLLRETIDFTTTNVDDSVMLVYDPSVKAIQNYRVGDLQSFVSEKDGVYKYLLHPAKTEENLIDFVDDIDVYVIAPDGYPQVGLYFHRNRKSSLRMVTHRDYAIPVLEVKQLISTLSQILSADPIDPNGFKIRLYLRKSGLSKPLIMESSRIFELYKLKDEDILAAMIGKDALVPEWTAAKLESSAYSTLMAANYREIDGVLSETMFGYRAITKLLAESPLKIIESNGTRYVYLPAAFYSAATVYEYDKDGYLLGYYPHSNSLLYMPVNPECTLIEPIVGNLSDHPSVYYGQDYLDLPTDANWRVYMCYLVDGAPNLKWRDITGTELYRVEFGKLRWNNLEVNQWLMVRTDDTGIAYTESFPLVADTLYFTLYEVVDGKKQVMTVPMGDLDLWLNKRMLIENLDYVVDFPKVMIFAKEYFTRPLGDHQTVDVRFTGFCNRQLERDPAGDYGFVQHGVLSRNSRYDVREDAVLRIVTRGRVRHFDDLLFSESDAGIRMEDPLNGSPYLIEKVSPGLKRWTEEDNGKMREIAEATDQRISNYLTLKLPEPERPAVSTIPRRYILVSPFFCHLVKDLAVKEFNMAALDRVLSDNEVIDLCRPYEELLKLDPLNEELSIDTLFVVIHPTAHYTPVALPLKAYRFMEQVVKLYGRGLIKLSPHVVIQNGG